MKKSTRTAIIVLVLLIIAAALIQIFMPSIKTIASGSQLHTAIEVQESYDKGYLDAARNEEYLKNLTAEQRATINELREMLTNKNIENSQLKKQLNELIIEVESLKAELATFQKSAGLYDEHGELQTTWQEMLDNEYISIDEFYALDHGTNVDELKNLTGNLILPDGIYSIKEGAFYETKFKNIYLPSTLVSIGQSSFQAMSNLEKIYIPRNVTYLGANSFMHCMNLETAIVAANVKEFKPNTFMGCSSLKVVHLSDSIENLNLAFTLCSALEKIELPTNLKIINEGEFQGCSKLKEIRVPDAVTFIGLFAFSGCKELRKIYIPETVTTIQTFREATPVDIKGLVFDRCENLTIYTNAAHANAGWGEFWNYSFNDSYNGQIQCVTNYNSLLQDYIKG